jgi:phage shock protein E
MVDNQTMPFLKQIYAAAPTLVGRNESEDISAKHGDAFVRLANDARRRIREITPEELAKFKELPLIVDVREKDEFIKGHICGAKHLSRGILEQKILDLAPDCSRSILVYCAGGHRGALAADSLQKMGYQNVFSLMRGLSGWLEAGGVVEVAKRGREERSGGEEE